MASVFHFGVSTERPTRTEAKRRHRIARQYDAEFIECDEPGGYRCWFSAKNMGEPFDSGRAFDVASALEAERSGLGRCR